MLITPEYLELNKELHSRNKEYGSHGYRFAPHVRRIAEALSTTDVLDYGCGKGVLASQLPFPIKQYDPAVEKYSQRPQAADIVVCQDVLEHIEPECLESVITDLTSLTKNLLFINVSLVPAQKVLNDGRNAHLIVMPSNWWLMWFLPNFYLFEYRLDEKEFSATLGVIPDEEKEKQPQQQAGEENASVLSEINIVSPEEC